MNKGTAMNRHTESDGFRPCGPYRPDGPTEPSSHRLGVPVSSEGKTHLRRGKVLGWRGPLIFGVSLMLVAIQPHVGWAQVPPGGRAFPDAVGAGPFPDDFVPLPGMPLPPDGTAFPIGPEGGGQFPGGAPGPRQGGAAFAQIPGGAGGFGGFGGATRAIAAQFDVDGNGWLDAEERAAALAFLASQPATGGVPGGGGFGGNLLGGIPDDMLGGLLGDIPDDMLDDVLGGIRGGMLGGGGLGGGLPGGGAFGGGGATVSPGIPLTPEDVTNHAGVDLYDTSVIRTIFIEFDVETWEADMAAFRNTDVRMPATVTVDGQIYELVGVHFRGNSSFSMASPGQKRPLGLKFDFVIEGQGLEGYRTHNLLNSSGDSLLMRAALYSEIAQNYIPIPKVGFVRVVINGENWGIYQNQQQYNRDFLADFFPGQENGVRWQVPGNPNGQGGLVYLGENIDAYRATYEIDNRDTEASWNALIHLTRVLSQTPLDQLVAALEPILDIEKVLRFLALDVALVNGDGYWTRRSDYYLYLAPDGRFRLIPHDFNEGLSTAGGFGVGGMGGGMLGAGPGGGGGVQLDPLVNTNNANDALRSRLLAVPELRKRYLEIMLDIAETWLDWETIGPIATAMYDLIAEDVLIDTRKLTTNAAFQSGLEGDGNTLQAFFDQRRAYLLSVLPGLIAAIPGPAYVEPETVVLQDGIAIDTDRGTVVHYSTKAGPAGWHLTTGAGSVIAEAGSPALSYFVFDRLTDGFGDNKIDQCVPIYAAEPLSISYSVYAATADPSGLAVRINPNFFANLDACEAAMAIDAGGDRLSGGRANTDIDFILGADDGQRWLERTPEQQAALAYGVADIPAGSVYMRLSVRARDRSGVVPQAELRIGSVTVTQGAATQNLLVNGSFSVAGAEE